jgi:hypothetical protein
MLSTFVIPGEGERSEPQTRIKAARESANLPRTPMLKHFAVAPPRPRFVPDLRCAAPGMTKDEEVAMTDG